MKTLKKINLSKLGLLYHLINESMDPKIKNFLKSPEFRDTITLTIELLLFVYGLAFFLPYFGVYLSYHQLMSLFAIYKILLFIFYSSDPYTYEEDDEKYFNSLKK